MAHTINLILKLQNIAEGNRKVGIQTNSKPTNIYQNKSWRAQMECN